MIANNSPTDTKCVFPDDELQRLKVWVKDNPHEDDDGLSIRGTKRLLERLDAAERCAGYLGSLAVLDTTMEVLLKEWREVSGQH